MTSELAAHAGHRFPAEIVGHAVWLYRVFGLSLRDVEPILAERGIAVTHGSVRQWCLRFGADFARKPRRRRPKPGGTRRLDEVFLRINGVLHCLWRAVDQHGVVLDILCRTAGTRPRPSASSSACWPGSSPDRGGPSPTGRRATASPGAESCPTCGAGPAAT